VRARERVVERRNADRRSAVPSCRRAAGLGTEERRARVKGELEASEAARGCADEPSRGGTLDKGRAGARQHRLLLHSTHARSCSVRPALPCNPRSSRPLRLTLTTMPRALPDLHRLDASTALGLIQSNEVTCGE